ncbi:MAG: hypothetical protein JWR58_1526, partial [Pseudonocardia sp.]|nr:hypothetical protein [Pseudonocardia sp.]
MDVAYDGPQVVGLDLHRRLRQLCSGIKSGAHAVLAKNRLCIPRSDVFGLDGRRRLAEL